MWIEGKPDFRVVDPERVDKCVEDKLCAICGKRLGEYCIFVGGPLSKVNHLFVDPPMHPVCAEFASQTCPFLSGRKDEYSQRLVDESVVRVEAMAANVRPEVMYILKTRTKTVRRVSVGGSLLIQAGRWLRVQEVERP